MPQVKDTGHSIARLNVVEEAHTSRGIVLYQVS